MKGAAANVLSRDWDGILYISSLRCAAYLQFIADDSLPGYDWRKPGPTFNDDSIYRRSSPSKLKARLRSNNPFCERQEKGKQLCWKEGISSACESMTSERCWTLYGTRCAHPVLLTRGVESFSRVQSLNETGQGSRIALLSLL